MILTPKAVWAAGHRFIDTQRYYTTFIPLTGNVPCSDPQESRCCKHQSEQQMSDIGVPLHLDIQGLAHYLAAVDPGPVGFRE